MLSDIEKNNIHNIISLGDVCGYYCMVSQCIRELREREIQCLMGNHDFYLVNGSCCDSKTVRICIDYQRNRLEEDYKNWLKSLPTYMDDELCSFRHGGWIDPLEERIECFDFDSIGNMEQKLFFSGHTHIQTIQIYGDKKYCNPGSVGQPRDHDMRAAYVIVEGNEITPMRVPYDIERIVYEMKKSGLGSWIWECLYEGKRIGE